MRRREHCAVGRRNQTRRLIEPPACVSLQGDNSGPIKETSGFQARLAKVQPARRLEANPRRMSELSRKPTQVQTNGVCREVSLADICSAANERPFPMLF